MSRVEEILTDSELSLFKHYVDADTSWGSLHITMDDGNIQDHHVQWCLERATKEKDEDGVKIARILLRLSEEDRGELYGWF